MNLSLPTDSPLPVRAVEVLSLSHEEIAELAYSNWQRGGCPSGRDLDYWLEAEGQLQATWHLLMTVCNAGEAAEVLSEVHLSDLAMAFGERSG